MPSAGIAAPAPETSDVTTISTHSGVAAALIVAPIPTHEVSTTAAMLWRCSREHGDSNRAYSPVNAPKTA